MKSLYNINLFFELNDKIPKDLYNKLIEVLDKSNLIGKNM